MTPRTTGPRSQNTRFRGHCKSVAEQLSTPGRPYTTNEIADAIKRMAVDEGYPVTMAIDGVVVPQSEAHASMHEATILITVVQRFADEHGLWLIEYVDGKPTKVWAGVTDGK